MNFCRTVGRYSRFRVTMETRPFFTRAVKGASMKIGMVRTTGLEPVYPTRVRDYRVNRL